MNEFLFFYSCVATGAIIDLAVNNWRLRQTVKQISRIAINICESQIAARRKENVER